MFGMTLCNTKSIVDWLTDGARSALRPDIMLADLCDRLVQAGSRSGACRYSCGPCIPKSWGALHLAARRRCHDNGRLI